MAGVSSADNLQNMVECSICAEEFKDPRILPCVHTFCLKCLEQTGLNKRPGENLPCPLCRSVFKIPDTGIQGIPKNFFMESLLDMHRQSKVHSKTLILCDACFEDDSVEEKPLAFMMCIECKQKLCDNCGRCHKRSRASKQHQLVDLKSKEIINHFSKDSALSFCDVHANEPIKMYCCDCRLVACMICHVEEHQGHVCRGVGAVGEEFRSELEANNRKIFNYFSSAKQKRNTLVKNIKRISDRAAKLHV